MHTRSLNHDNIKALGCAQRVVRKGDLYDRFNSLQSLFNIELLQGILYFS